MGSRQRRHGDFINTLQGQYNADAKIKAEKDKLKEDERRRERIAKAERMGLGLGTRLGTSPGNGPGTATRLDQVQRQGNHVDKLQLRYNQDAVAKEQEQEVQRLEAQKRRIELLKLQQETATRNAGDGTGAPLGKTEDNVNQEEARRRRVAKLQEDYERSRANKTNGNAPSSA